MLSVIAWQCCWDTASCSLHICIPEVQVQCAVFHTGRELQEVSLNTIFGLHHTREVGEVWSLLKAAHLLTLIPLVIAADGGGAAMRRLKNNTRLSSHLSQYLMLSGIAGGDEAEQS